MNVTRSQRSNVAVSLCPGKGHSEKTIYLACFGEKPELPEEAWGEDANSTQKGPGLPLSSSWVRKCLSESAGKSQSVSVPTSRASLSEWTGLGGFLSVGPSFS